MPIQPPLWRPPPEPGEPLNVLADAWAKLKPRTRKRIVWTTAIVFTLAIFGLPAGVMVTDQLRTPAELAGPAQPPAMQPPIKPQPPREIASRRLAALGPWTETAIAANGLPVRSSSLLRLSPNGSVQTSLWATTSSFSRLNWQPASPGNLVIDPLASNQEVTFQLAGSSHVFHLHPNQVFVSDSNSAYLYSVDSQGQVWQLPTAPLPIL